MLSTVSEKELGYENIATIEIGPDVLPINPLHKFWMMKGLTFECSKLKEREGKNHSTYEQELRD